MTCAARVLVAAVYALGGTLEPDGDSIVCEAPNIPPWLLAMVREREAEIVQALTGAGSPAGPYLRRLARARDRADLLALVADAQVAFAFGRLSGEDVEDLAREAHNFARCLRRAARA